MDKKIINGRECYYEEVKFSIDDFHQESDDTQATYNEEDQSPYIQEVKVLDPNQELYSVATYRVRIQEAERPIFVRLKLMLRDAKMLVRTGNLDEKKMERLKRLFTDDLTALLQEAADSSRNKQGGQTVDMILKLNTLNNAEITKAGRELGIILRQINRIREKMNFIPKLQQEKLNAVLVNLISLITNDVFNSTNLKTYGGFVKDEASN